MTNPIISKSKARQFLVNHHHLSDYDLIGKSGILQFVTETGCIQYDPLNVVGKNADLVLQARIKNYKEKQLFDMLYKDRTLIDGWDKMMAIYLTTDFPNFSRIRTRRTLASESEMAYRDMSDALEVVEEVRAMVHRSGPLMARDLSIGEGNKGRWGHRKLSSVALDYMFHRGELGIHTKKNTHKSFDLIERLLPEEVISNEDPFDDDEAFYKWYVLRRIRSMGLLWARNGGAWLGHFIYKKEIRNKVIQMLLEENLITKVFIESIKEPFYVLTDYLEILLNTEVSNKKKVRFLAPLDNLMWDRDLIEQVFDFKYTWEVYVPESKRQYGYYVLPVLYGNEFIARFEPNLYRGETFWSIKNWWWQENIRKTKKLEKALITSFKSFSKYLGASGLDSLCLEEVLKDF
ncbi:MAG: AlkZ family DNA glycosylase [Clostridia bacterium]|nr:AlkZ family DNA glycosylase [Clostridia bacterium]